MATVLINQIACVVLWALIFFSKVTAWSEGRLLLNILYGGGKKTDE